MKAPQTPAIVLQARGLALGDSDRNEPGAWMTQSYAQVPHPLQRKLLAEELLKHRKLSWPCGPPPRMKGFGV